MRRGFTLVELLVCIVVIATLTAISGAVYSSVRRVAFSARCTASLSQLGAATWLYLSEHDNRFFPYAQNTAAGKVWYFGLETSGGSGAEGERELDPSAGPLAPYLGDGGRVEICPAFNYGSALWKPKFKGASWGYGYNWRLGGGPSGRNPKHITSLSSLNEVVVFGDCGQINTFQSPASPDNPLVEEFYIINESFQTVHFRHGKHANFLFADGHVDGLPLEPGTRDKRLDEETIGRIAPVGSLRHLE